MGGIELAFGAEGHSFQVETVSLVFAERLALGVGLEVGLVATKA